MQVDDLVTPLIAYKYNKATVVRLDIVVDERRDARVELLAHNARVG